MSVAEIRCSIFCRVIDNFGDAGVCWRLAKQLWTEHQWQVTLFIDELSLLHKLIDANETSGVALAPWKDATDTRQLPDVVIEAFACEPPAHFVTAMANALRPPVWINLEYLTAEPWIEAAHRLVSPHPATGLKKHFFFPGFTAKTGGLLRESDYEVRRLAASQHPLLWRLNLNVEPSETLISYFAYANAPRHRLIDELSMLDRPVRLIEPGGQGTRLRVDKLTIEPIPFLSQTQYDELLLACDINFVRGEDSFVRAQWAAKPFIWNIYAQEGGTHLKKLEAFLERYLDPQVGAGETAILRNLWRAWNNDSPLGMKDFIDSLPDQHRRARHWQKHLLGHTDLAKQLVEFCDKLRDRLN